MVSSIQSYACEGGEVNPKVGAKAELAQPVLMHLLVQLLGVRKSTTKQALLAESGTHFVQTQFGSKFWVITAKSVLHQTAGSTK